MDKWQPKQRIEIQYALQIHKIVERVLKGEAVPLLSAEAFLRKYAAQAAQRMVVGLLWDSARTWRDAARFSMQGERIFTSLRSEMQGPVGERVRALINRNARLISSLPYDIAQKVAQKVAESHFEGVRAENFVTAYTKHLAAWHARLIARTEISKASTALTQARSEEMGLQWWVWRTSKDQRVRPAHRKMENVLCSWNDLPSPELLLGEKSYGHYAAGNIFNCRCYPEPLLYLDQLAWPHRVYRAGSIKYVTRAEFRLISRIPISVMEAA